MLKIKQLIEFFNSDGEHWMSILYDVKPKKQFFLTPVMQGELPNIEWRLLNSTEIQTTTNIIDIINDKN